MAPRADAKANQQQGGKQRQQGLFAGSIIAMALPSSLMVSRGDQAPQIWTISSGREKPMGLTSEVQNR